MERVLLCLFGLFFVPETAKSESFSATVKLQQLPEQEKGLITALDNYLKSAVIESEETKASLERFLAQARKANSAAEKDEFFSEKPINAFLLIRRLAEGWGHVTETICGDEDDMDEEKFEYCQARDNVVRLSANWPSKEDLKGATSAMIRLADFYQLDFLDMANGVIKGIKMMPLSIDDFNFIADSAVEENQEYLASIWYKKTLQVLEKMAPTDLATKTRLQRKLASLYYKNGLHSKALKTIGEAIKDNTSHKGARRDFALYRTRVPAENSAEPPRIPRPEFMVEASVMSTYRRLCRGNMKSPKEMAELHCRYRPTLVPFSPSKIEFANIDPPVVLFHELLSEKEMEHAKNTSTIYLQRSIVGDRRVESSIRISQTAWLGEMDDILLRMSRKVELHTGLSAMFSDSLSHAEPWQVLNYGIGGMYVPHEDSVASLIGKTDIPALVNSGDRMATFLFYLNDVTAGGATVFPYLKTRVPVVKGAAALWYNLLRNGTPDSRHLHAGCPVLVGSKWVSNKWIREIGQTFRRPCALDRNL